MTTKTRGRLLSLVIVALLLAAIFAGLQWHERSRPRAVRLPDGTTAYFRGDTTVQPAQGYPHPREIRVDGDVFLQTSAGAAPVIVRSRLLILEVSGPAALRVTAYSRESGEQAEVLRGNVTARKSYPSPHAEPDQLAGGEMVMVNRTIDLMEKENMRANEIDGLRDWSTALIQELSSSADNRS